MRAYTCACMYVCVCMDKVTRKVQYTHYLTVLFHKPPNQNSKLSGSGDPHTMNTCIYFFLVTSLQIKNWGKTLGTKNFQKFSKHGSEYRGKFFEREVLGSWVFHTRYGLTCPAICPFELKPCVSHAQRGISSF